MRSPFLIVCPFTLATTSGRSLTASGALSTGDPGLVAVAPVLAELVGLAGAEEDEESELSVVAAAVPDFSAAGLQAIQPASERASPNARRSRWGDVCLSIWIPRKAGSSGIAAKFWAWQCSREVGCVSDDADGRHRSPQEFPLPIRLPVRGLRQGPRLIVYTLSR